MAIQKMNKVKVLDYGCGSGALSFSFRDNAKKIIFVDVKNFSARFIKYRMKKYNLHAKWFEVNSIRK